MVQDLKRVASELGKTPTRREYEVHGKFSRSILEKVFGGFTKALQAAGLQRNTPAKIEEILCKDLGEQLREYGCISKVDNRIPKMVNLKKTIVAGDLHFPFCNQGTLKAFYEFLKEHRPERCVQVGDLYDMFSHSKFPASRNLYTPAQEMKISHDMAKEFWSTVRTLCPGIECFQLLGNHDIRPIKRILELYPAGELFFSLEPFYTFEGVKTIFDPREELILDDIVFHHGYRSNLGGHRDFNLSNTVVGHTHTGGVAFRQVRGETLWELNAGYMGDPDSKGLAYTPQRMTNWTQGFGWIDPWGPRFILV